MTDFVGRRPGLGVSSLTVADMVPSTTPYINHPLGTQAMDEAGNIYRWVKAGGTIGAGKIAKAVVGGTTPYDGVLLGDGVSKPHIGLAPVTFTIGQYGWLLKEGVYVGDAVVVSSAIADGDPLAVGSAGTLTKAATTDIVNAVGVCITDDTDNTGTVLMRFD